MPPINRPPPHVMAGQFRLNRDSPLAERLRVCCVSSNRANGATLVDLSRRYDATINAGTVGIGPLGREVVFSGSSGQYAANTVLPKATWATGALSVAVWFRNGSASTTSCQLMSSRSTLNNGFALNLETFNNTGKVGFTYMGVADYASSALATPTDSSPSVLVVSARATTARIMLNGVFENKTVGTITAPTLDGYVIAGLHRNNAYSGEAPATILSAMIWTRCLSDAEMWDLYARPYDLYAIPRRRTYSVPAAPAVSSFPFPPRAFFTHLRR